MAEAKFELADKAEALYFSIFDTVEGKKKGAIMFNSTALENILRIRRISKSVLNALKNA